MNKKGFATSTIIFSLLSVFLITISILLFTMSNTNSLNDSINNKVVQNIEYGENSSINDIQNQLKELQKKYDDLAGTVSKAQIDKIYPVGSIYITTSDKSPKDLFPGTEWNEYSQGRVLVGYNWDSVAYNTIGKTGGSATATLTTDNLPSHSHSFTPAGTITNGLTFTTASAGSHTHALSGVMGWPASGDGSTKNYAYSGWAQTTGVYSKNVTKTESAGSHTHKVNMSGSLTFKGTASTTGKTGSGKEFSVLDPYTVVHIYKRTK